MMKRFVFGLTLALAGSVTLAAGPQNKEAWKDLEINERNGVAPKKKVAAPAAKPAPKPQPAAAKKPSLPEMKPFTSSYLKALADFKAHETQTLATVEERLQYDPRMYPYYTGTILPQPQKAKYYDRFAPIDRVGIVLGKGLKPADARVAVLINRIGLYGGTAKVIPVSAAQKCKLVISIGETPFTKRPEAPDHAEGYAIKVVSPQHVAVAYRDELGLLWAMSSLRQLVTKEKMRLADIEDYPSTTCRRMVPCFGTDAAAADRFLQTKCSEAFYHLDTFTQAAKFERWGWEHTNFPAACAPAFQHIGASLNPLGIAWYGGLQMPGLDSKDETHFKKITDFAEMCAAAGGNFWFDWDDWRFLGFYSTNEIRNFGSIREADVYIVNKVYRAVRAKYPQIKFVFCPPCYWRNAAGKPSFKESTDAYWQAMGTRFPKDIAVQWTGDHVFSTCITSQEVQRVTKLLGRKPTYWQNRTLWGDHPACVFYLGYGVPYGEKYGVYYKGILNDLEGFYLNSATFGSDCAVGCYLWNPEAYDADVVAKEVAMRMVGPENYQNIKAWAENLAKVDPYYSACRRGKISAEAVQHFREIEGWVRTSMEALNAVAEARPATMALDVEVMFRYAGAYANRLPEMIRRDPRTAAQEAKKE